MTTLEQKMKNFLLKELAIQEGMIVAIKELKGHTKGYYTFYENQKYKVKELQNMIDSKPQIVKVDEEQTMCPTCDGLIMWYNSDQKICMNCDCKFETIKKS